LGSEAGEAYPGIDNVVLVESTSSPAEELAALATLIQAFGLPRGRENSLLAKVSAADAALARGNTRAACNQLQALINEARAQSGKQLTASQVTEITGSAEAIRSELGCR
jgi:hypothetical protein